LVGQDGPTHHGVFDIAMLRTIPNMRILAPRNEVQLRNTLFTLQHEMKGPVAVRYPRGYGQIPDWEQPFQKIDLERGHCLHEGKEIAILSAGTLAHQVSEALKIAGTKPTPAHYDLGCIKPLDEKLLHHIFTNFTSIISVEDGSLAGGAGSAVLEWANENGYQQTIKRLGIPDEFIPHGTTEKLYQEVGLDAVGIAKVIEAIGA
jgi:1-deoxy-D-xylulose-5-phosphate synthase